jgi:hypothetical protein
VLGIAAASFNSQLAMALFVKDSHGFGIDNLQASVPARVAFVAVVAAVDVWLGLCWLHMPAPAARKRRRERAIPAAAAIASASIARPSREGIFGRLLWQSLRQSWKTALAALLIGLFLMFAVELIFTTFVRAGPLRNPFDVFSVHYIYWPLSLLFVPALFGALAFRADQRGRQYRFLAEHAGRPRILWLARQVAWLGPIIVLAVGTLLFVWLLVGEQFVNRLPYAVRGYEVLGMRFSEGWSNATQLTIEHGISVFIQSSITLVLAALAAYAVGQLLSLALSSDVLAAMLALGASVVITAWAYVVIMWRLSPWLFITPLALGALLATWVRVKDWLVDRSSVVRWLTPAAAIFVPTTAMLCCVPAARMAQVSAPYQPVNVETFSFQSIADAAASELARGREVADDYVRIASEIADRMPEETAEDIALRRVRWPVDTAEFDDEIVRLSRIECRIPLLLDYYDPASERLRMVAFHAYKRAALLRADDLDAALEMLLAARRIESQLLRGVALSAQVTSESLDSPAWQNGGRQLILMQSNSASEFLGWSIAPGQTAERVQRAVDELGQIDQRGPTPAVAVTNAYLRIKSVLRGREFPRYFPEPAGRPIGNWIAILLNEVFGEAARNERALDILATCGLDYAIGAHTGLLTLDQRANVKTAFRANLAGSWRERLRKSYRGYPGTGSTTPLLLVAEAHPLHTYGYGANYRSMQARADLVTAALTSRLVADEFTDLWLLPRHVADWLADVAWRRAERVRLALIAYRLKNGSYPPSLDALSPDYLSPAEIRDPFADGPLQYKEDGFPFWALETSIDRSSLIVAPPNTPMLWSIGTGEAVPIETDAMVNYNQAGNPASGRITDPREELVEDKDNRIERVIVLYRMLGSFWMPLPTDFAE